MSSRARLRCAASASAGFGTAWSLVGLVLLLAESSWCAPRQVSLQSEGSLVCASPAEIGQALQRHLPGTEVVLTPVEEGTAKVWFHFERDGAGVRVEVLVEQGEGRGQERSFSVADCSEAVLASTFVAAVLVDPSVGGSDAAVAASSGAAGSKDRSSPDAGAPAGEEDRAPRPPEEELLTPETATSRRARSSSGKAQPYGQAGSGAGASAFVVTLGARAIVDLGPAPDPLWGIAFAAGIGGRKTGFWAPSVELQVGYQWADPVVQPSGTARFEFGAVALHLCPSRAIIGRARLSACVSARGGWMSAGGVDTFQPASVVRPWVDLGARFDATLRLVGPVGVFGGLGLGIPLIRDSFQFDGDVFFEVPPVAMNGALGVTVDFF